MIKLTATIDSCRGIIPNGQFPSIDAYNSRKMGKAHIKAVESPFTDDLGIDSFFDLNRNVWLLAPPHTYEQLLPRIDLLHVTQIDGIYDVKDSFPKFEDKFILIKRGRIHNEGGVFYQHQVWLNKLLAKSEDIRDTNAR